MSEFVQRFEEMEFISDVARRINSFHAEDLSLVTEQLILGYLCEFESVKTMVEPRDLCRLHSVIGKHLLKDPKQIGCYRTCMVTVGGDTPCHPSVIADRIEAIFPIIDPREWYRQFQIIHPFADGNGRVGGIVAAVEHYRRTGLWLAPCQ